MVPDLFVSDLDGTLLASDATLSHYARINLKALLDSGLQFTIATARALPSIRSLLGGLPLSLPVIELNGALLTRLDTGGPLKVHALPSGLAANVLGQMMQDGMSPFVATAGPAKVRLHYDRTANAAMRWFLDEKREKGDRRLQRTPRLRDSLQGQVLGLTVLDEKAAVHELQEELLEMHANALQVHCFEQPYCPGYWELAVQDVQATKANAIGALRALAGGQYERLTVFGDNVNDLDMFQTADRAVAVRNAVAPVLRRATEVTASNDEDGVVRWLCVSPRRSPS